MKILQEKIQKFLAELPAEFQSIVKKEESLALHTTFLLGGKADLFVEPRSVQEVQFFFCLAKKHQIPCTILGLGSNVLISDKGIRGMVMCLHKPFSSLAFLHKENLQEMYPQIPSKDLEDVTGFFAAEAGASLKDCSLFAYEQGYQGFSFAIGIPGSVGGAVYMNAGAYGGEMKDVVLAVECLDAEGQMKLFLKDELSFAYRQSIFKSTENLVILRIFFALKKGDQAKILAEMEEFTEKRNASQPLDLASAGSMFKRPEGFFAGKLISDAGLKGFHKGAVGVSEKHAGFVVHYGGGSTQEVIDFVRQIQKEVYDQFSVHLEPEVRLLGEGVESWN